MPRAKTLTVFTVNLLTSHGDLHKTNDAGTRLGPDAWKTSEADQHGPTVDPENHARKFRDRDRELPLRGA